MAVIVKGMDMPESCSDCPICHCKGKDEPWNYYCSATMNDINIQEWDLTRNDNCPLRSVDGLIEKIETDMSHYMYDDYGNTTTEHDVLVGIIKEYCGLEE